MRKATDMSRMMAQLTMEAITATLKPRDSCSGMAGKETPSSSWGAARLSLVLSKPTPRGDQEALAAEAVATTSEGGAIREGSPQEEYH